MKASASRRFGAFIAPDRVYVIEYRRDASGIEILDHMSVARSMPDVEDATEAVVDLIRLSVPAPDEAQLTAAIRGFGISYHLLTLPPAGAVVLAPIIEREMRRLFPEVGDPVVAFAVAGRIDRRTGKPTASPNGVSERREPAETDEILPLEILAATAPRHVVDSLAYRLRDAGIRLQHLTVVPQAMARLYGEVDGSPEPAAMAIMLPGAPIIGVFQGGEVRFISEPPASNEALAAVDLQTVIDQVGRARMHLRQHFRGADIEKIFVASEPAEEAHVAAVLNGSLNLEVVPLAPTIGPPEAIAALGSVLNAELGTEMVLYPSADQLRRKAEKRRTRGWTLAAAGVCMFAIAFAVVSAVSAGRSAAALKVERGAADAQMARTASAMDVIGQRRANMERTSAMQAHASGRQHLARLLAGIRLAQPPNVALTTATLIRTASGWRVELAGTATGPTGAAVLEGVDSFSRELPARIPLQSFQLDSLGYADDESQVTANFAISFTSAPAQ